MIDQSKKGFIQISFIAKIMKIIITYFLVCSCVSIKNFDVGFGTSQMFIGETDRQELLDKEKTILPTTSSLIYLEPFLTESISLPIFVNVPTSSQKFIVDHVEYVETSSNVIGLGVGWKYAVIELPRATQFELEFMALGASVRDQDDKDKGIPLISQTFRLARENGTTLFFGVEKTLGLNVSAIFYGLGQRF